ncbi:GerAB/ArcD/ProY family transporter [Aneurinibacillus sp. Ricciae_BoGa-3]|uniref:GerAB/ArcD/ProY family transporter n=1 Tax=Aneurinibacillus sp. Ricciae_BoGa-3 TaxID=3022697 RepID=UPI002340ACBB|nr:GerAB/ArcD/ProY family transporter [Aneurinibacillus sp. Ricciae_BoGa-3]WCK55677.1 GerAB/ArcD/ProY family transporter [Aneurinibacillus sp. Ricciae_BoGa-3]
MEKERISASQLFALIFLFEMGTALVIPIGFSGQQGVWLSILLALFGGILLFLVYDYLFRQYPDLPLSGYAQKILGKYIGWPLSLLYVPFFIYIAARDLREAGDLLVTTAYNQTPTIAIVALMIVAVVYVLRKGIEVLARTGEIYLLILIILGTLGNIFLLFSGVIDVKNLLPLLEKGWKPILSTAYPKIFMFPFGEMICFTTIFPYLNKHQSGRKTGMAALVFSAVVLSLTHAVQICVLGADMYGRSTFPLFTTITKVNIANFLQRLDAIALLTLIIGDFFKISIYCYAAIIVASNLFKVQKNQNLLWPIGIIVLFSSMMIANNLPEHMQEGKLVLHFLLPLFSVAFPLLLLVVQLIRKRFGLFTSTISADDKG